MASDRLIAVAAMWLFVAIGSDRRIAETKSGLAVMAAAGGFLGARLAYGLSHLDAFRAEPLSIFAVWQGGFVTLAGIAGAAIIVLARARRPFRTRLLLLLLAASLAWFAAERLFVTKVASPLALTGVRLTMLDGAPFNRAASSGRPVVVNLWADWCPPCRREMPVLAEAAQANPDVQMLLINEGDRASQALRLPSQQRIDPKSIVLDPLARLSAAYGGTLPTTIFLGADGAVRSVHSGAITPAALLDGLALIKEPKP